MLKCLRETFFALLFIALAACSAAGTTAVGNPSGNQTSPTISIGQLQADGQSDISIPLEIFGDSADDVDDASVDVDVNGARYSRDLDASSYYNLVAAAVNFTMSELVDADIVKFTVHLENGDDTVFVGTVSATAAAEASSDAVQQLIDALCTDLSACYTASTYSTCYLQLLSTEQLDDEFFAESAEMDENSLSMQDIAEGLNAGTYTADSTVLDTCLADLQALSCTQLDVGYAESSAEDYENVENFVSESCVGIFAVDSSDDSNTDTETSTDSGLSQ